MTSSAPQVQHIQDLSNHKRYFFQVPNLYDDADLSPAEFRLMMHYLRRGTCKEGIRTTAQVCRMSVGQASQARKSLCDKGLIKLEPIENNAIRVVIVDQWEANMQRYQNAQAQRSECESPGVHNMNTAQAHQRSASEHQRSVSERKNNMEKNEKREPRARARPEGSLSQNEGKGKASGQPLPENQEAAVSPEIAYWRSQRAVSCNAHGLPLPDPSATDHDAAKMLALIKLHLRGASPEARLQCIKDFLAAPPKNAFERGHRWGPPSFAGYAPLWRMDHSDLRPGAPPPEPTPVSHSEERANRVIAEMKALEAEAAQQTPEERIAKVRAARAAAGCARPEDTPREAAA